MQDYKSLRVVVIIGSTLVKMHRNIQPLSGYTGLLLTQPAKLITSDKMHKINFTF